VNDALQRGTDAGERPPGRSMHAVQFYETDDYLVGAGAAFLGAGLADERACVLIATEAHRREIASELGRHGLDVGLLERDDRLVMIDAAQMLGSFMIGGMPDEILLRASAEPMLRRATHHSRGGRPLVLGEGVDVLWRGGERAAALRVEEIWSDLARHHEMDALCNYRLDSFAHATDSIGFADVCHHHSAVIPTERFTELSDEGRLLEISRLQQRSLALETEVARISRLELRLRLALERERDAREALARSERSERDLLALIGNLLGAGDDGGGESRRQ
jgi:MEDS: MEthanogen/methylotroph, DcmR Sensory domain